MCCRDLRASGRTVSPDTETVLKAEESRQLLVNTFRTQPEVPTPNCRSLAVQSLSLQCSIQSPDLTLWLQDTEAGRKLHAKRLGGR